MPLKTLWPSELRLFVESTIAAGMSGVGRCVLGSNLCVRPEGTARWLVATVAVELWVGFHGTSLRALEREPFDQSSPAAYMPLSRTDCDEVPLPSGALLVQRTPWFRVRLHQQLRQGGGGRHASCMAENREAALSQVMQLLLALGVDGGTAPALAGTLVSRLLEAYEAGLSRPLTTREAASFP